MARQQTPVPSWTPNPQAAGPGQASFELKGWAGKSHKRAGKTHAGNRASLARPAPRAACGAHPAAAPLPWWCMHLGRPLLLIAELWPAPYSCPLATEWRRVRNLQYSDSHGHPSSVASCDIASRWCLVGATGTIIIESEPVCSTRAGVTSSASACDISTNRAGPCCCTLAPLSC